MPPEAQVDLALWGAVASALSLISAASALIENALSACARARLQEVVSKAAPDKRESLRLGAEAVLGDGERAIRAAELLKVACAMGAAACWYVCLGRGLGWGAGRLLAAGAVLVVVIELIPQGFGSSYAEEIVAFSGWTIGAISLVASPLVRVAEGIEAVFDRLRGKPGPGTGEEMIEEEIRAIVSDGEAHGVLDDETGRMIQSAFGLLGERVSDIMTPRTDLVCIDVKSSFEDVLRLAVKAGHSRIPVFDGTPDRIVGILYQKDLLKHWGKPQGSVSISEVMRQPYFIPESRPVWGLLKEMLSAKVHITVVLDEYGGTAGIVAVDDIVEELLGEMSDEFSQDSQPRIRKLGQNAVEVGARIRVDRLNHELGISLPENDDYDTLGGFMLWRLGRIPAAGESLDYAGLKMNVTEADDRRIKRVRIQKLPALRGK